MEPPLNPTFQPAEDAIHERKDKWNGPQTVTLDVDMPYGCKF